MAKRADFDSPKVKATRYACFKRDGFKCVMCGQNKDLQHHHIKTVAKYPELEFVVSNTITLCAQHHQEITGREHIFEEEFSRIVRINEEKSTGLKRKGYNKNKEINRIYRPRSPFQRF